MGTPRRAGPPYGLPAQATTQGGQFWTPIGGQYSTPVDTQTAMIENGFVSIPQSAPWLAEYLHEMTVFPNGKHDDQVDSTAQFLDWFKKPFPGQGIFEYYRREAEKLKPPKPVYVRIKAPPGIGAVQTFSGRHITIGEDRIAKMSEEDANCLIPVGWTLLTEPSCDASG